MKLITSLPNLFQSLLINSWWVILFSIFCYMGYEQGGKFRIIQFEGLSERLISLQLEKKKALSLQKDLIMQINSQSDPAWVELTLMRGLGLVPEGQIKVLFTQQ